MRSVINYFSGYTQKKSYVGDFDLESSIKIPKPCAETSAVMDLNTTVPFYYLG
jgi:hypothetical protein